MAKNENVSDVTRAKQRANTAQRKRVESGKKKGEFATETPKGKKGLARFETLVPRDEATPVGDFVARQEAAKLIAVREVNAWEDKTVAQANKIKKLTEAPTLSAEEKIAQVPYVVDRFNTFIEQARVNGNEINLENATYLTPEQRAEFDKIVALIGLEIDYAL